MTIPKSFPKVSCIKHRTRKTAIVVNDEPITEENVSHITSIIAPLLPLDLAFLSSYEWYKKIEKSVVTPSCKTATKALVIYDISFKKMFVPRFKIMANPILKVIKSGQGKSLTIMLRL